MNLREGGWGKNNTWGLPEVPCSALGPLELVQSSPVSYLLWSLRCFALSPHGSRTRPSKLPWVNIRPVPLPAASTATLRCLLVLCSLMKGRVTAFCVRISPSMLEAHPLSIHNRILPYQNPVDHIPPYRISPYQAPILPNCFLQARAKRVPLSSRYPPNNRSPLRQRLSFFDIVSSATYLDPGPVICDLAIYIYNRRHPRRKPSPQAPTTTPTSDSTTA